ATPPFANSKHPSQNGNRPSRSGAEGFFFGLSRFFFRSGSGGQVLNKFAAAFWLAFAFHLADSARGHVAGFQAYDAAFADYDLRAEPVGAVHASGGVEGHGGGDGAFEFVSRAAQEALAHFLRPGEASD